MSRIAGELEDDSEAYASSTKGNARRRVDAYHEALRERRALHDLEQPFVLEIQSWPPPRW